MAAELDDIDDLADLGDLGDLDIGDIEGVADEAEGASGIKDWFRARRKKIILFGIVAAVVTGAGAVLVSVIDTVPDRALEDADDADSEDEPKATPYYFTLDPAFVVNFVANFVDRSFFRWKERASSPRPSPPLRGREGN